MSSAMRLGFVVFLLLLHFGLPKKRCQLCPNEEGKYEVCLKFVECQPGTRCSDPKNFDSKLKLENTGVARTCFTWDSPKGLDAKESRNARVFAFSAKSSDEKYVPVDSCYNVSVANNSCNVIYEPDIRIHYCVTLNERNYTYRSAVTVIRDPGKQGKFCSALPDAVIAVKRKNETTYCRNTNESELNCFIFNEKGKLLKVKQLDPTSSMQAVHHYLKSVITPCVYQVSKDLIDLKLQLDKRNPAAEFFGRSLYNATSYSDKFAKPGTTCNDFAVSFPKMNYTARKDHFICFKMTVESVFFYCMEPKAESIDQTLTDSTPWHLVIVFILIAVLILAFFAFCSCKHFQRARANHNRLPYNLKEAKNKWNDQYDFPLRQPGEKPANEIVKKPKAAVESSLPVRQQYVSLPYSDTGTEPYKADWPGDCPGLYSPKDYGQADADPSCGYIKRSSRNLESHDEESELGTSNSSRSTSCSGPSNGIGSYQTDDGNETKRLISSSDADSACDKVDVQMSNNNKGVFYPSEAKESQTVSATVDLEKMPDPKRVNDLLFGKILKQNPPGQGSVLVEKTTVC